MRGFAAALVGGTLLDVSGVDPMTAIRATTIVPAETMGVERDYGSLEPGRWADVTAVHGDPPQRPGILRDPLIVIKHGIQYK